MGNKLIWALSAARRSIDALASAVTHAQTTWDGNRLVGGRVDHRDFAGTIIAHIGEAPPVADQTLKRANKAQRRKFPPG